MRKSLFMVINFRPKHQLKPYVKNVKRTCPSRFVKFRTKSYNVQCWLPSHIPRRFLISRRICCVNLQIHKCKILWFCYPDLICKNWLYQFFAKTDSIIFRKTLSALRIYSDTCPVFEAQICNMHNFGYYSTLFLHFIFCHI